MIPGVQRVAFHLFAVIIELPRFVQIQLVEDHKRAKKQKKIAVVREKLLDAFHGSLLLKEPLCRMIQSFLNLCIWEPLNYTMDVWAPPRPKSYEIHTVDAYPASSVALRRFGAGKMRKEKYRGAANKLWIIFT